MEYDHVIEALATNRSNHSLDVGSLPRRARCRQNFADAHISHLLLELTAEDGIAVAQQVTGNFGKGKGLSYLLSRPLRGRVGSNIEVKNATAIMGQHQEHVKNLETDGGDGEENHGDQLLRMILREGTPILRRQFAAAQHVFADTALSDVDAEFDQPAMDAGCTPAGILLAHPADKTSDLSEDDGSSGLAASYLQGPESAEAGTMPRYNSFWLDDGQR